MTYYKDKRKPFYQHPFFLGVLTGLVLILGMMAGYYFAKTTNPTPTSAQPIQTLAPPTNQEPTPIEASSTNKSETMDGKQALDQIQSVLNDSTALSANARIILQSQKNSPIVWEMSQQDPTKDKIASNPQIIQNSTIQPQQQIQAGQQPANNMESQPQEQTPSTPVGNQAVLHPEDIPANEHAGISHLQNPTPPTIQPKVKIQSVDKNDAGEPVKSLEIE